MKIIELIPLPGSQFHFGEILPQNEVQNMNAVASFPSSDLLFSALVNIWAKIFGDAGNLVALFENDKIQLSSAFFYLKYQTKTIRFLPKPVVAGLFKTEGHKKLKKIDFVSEDIVKNGILPTVWLNPEICTLIEGKFLCLSTELSTDDAQNISIYKELTVPKVKVHTTEKEHTLYSQNNIAFLPLEGGESGYYFYLNETLPEEEKIKFNTVLKLLIDEGLGGERSSGCGLFKEIRIGNVDSLLTDSSKYYLSLSLSNPATDEFNYFEYYKLTTRGGRRLQEGGRLKLVNMIAEGAIVSNKVSGRIVDISPAKNRRYLRYGKTFLFPLNTKFEQLWKTNQ